MECPACDISFTIGTLVPRTLERCGHTICHQCLIKLTDSFNSFHIKCPFCNEAYTKEEALSSPTNYFILQEISENQQILRKAGKTSHPWEKTCPYHIKTKLDFYCKTDRAYICAKCLLLGEHVGHTTVHA